ncbi:MAG: carboxymuconolactone decarboxylase family protein [Dissulfurimicrobium sp.]|uniref:carboxymuconolactone decarboxylase family protein n=1 Tax=Dissulfurimicrobium hydrothermale TaxID=1750598 RepID=UPI001EDB1578|nr:carboxymuconolactone decarboxylase family protein [Dissulfurimicrobium hydrothermale]UKL13814.1 carboxymuconolactone decarboxylase family protein [Dissulfurimicrobium hydrothermale]
MINQMPSVEQILGMMSQKLGGEENIPAAIKYAKDVAPELIMQVAMSSMGSVEDKDSPLEPKVRTLIFLSAALAMKDYECVRTQLRAALNMGVTKEELIAVIKIVRHAAANGVLGVATPILEALAGG